MDNSKPIIQASELSVDFWVDGEWVMAASGVNFSVKPGDVLAIVGESGSGKSVTSLSTMRLIPNPPGKIAGGEIIFHRENGPIDLVKASDKEMRAIRGNEISMIFRDFP